MKTKKLNTHVDYLAPDESEIRLLPTMKGGGLAHCTLDTGKISIAVKHKTVEEIWYVIGGRGQLWRQNNKEEIIINLEKGISATIPVNTAFQFKNTGNSPLRILISTMPPWPGKDEAVPVSGKW